MADRERVGPSYAELRRHEMNARSVGYESPTRSAGLIAISIGEQLRTLAISFECFGEMLKQMDAETRAPKEADNAE